HHVSTEKGQDIFMLVEKDYPLTKGLTKELKCLEASSAEYNSLGEAKWQFDLFKELASPEQTASGKDSSNPLIVDSLLKTIWLSMHHEDNQLPVVISSALTTDKKPDSSRFFKIIKGQSLGVLRTLKESTRPFVLTKSSWKMSSNQVSNLKDGPWVSPVQVVPKKGGMTVVKNEKDELIPQRTVTGWRVYGFSGYFQIPIAPGDQEKTTFTCPYGTFTYKRMPFGLCNAPATFQRCMIAIFLELIEDSMEVFIDDFYVFGSSFVHCLKNLEKMLKSDYAVGEVLGQRIDKYFKPIYYASKTMNEEQENYTTTKKELLDVVFAFEKFHQYLVLSKTIIHDKKGVENLAGDHLSRLKNPDLGKLIRVEIRDLFPEERLMAISDKNNKPWMNPSCSNSVPTESYEDSWPEMKQYKFFNNVTADHPGDIMASSPLQGRSLRPGIDFMGPFPSSNENKYILVAIDYVSKWVKAQAFPTSDARNIVNFLRRLFTRFEIPKALISDGGTHFYNYQIEKAMKRYGVVHRFSIAYHPQTNGQAFQTAFKTPLGTTPFRIIYGKACHLPVKLEHKAYWDINNCNTNLTKDGENQFLQINELDKMRLDAYESFISYKERTKRWHDKRIKLPINYKKGDKVLLFNSRLRLFPRKLKSRWYGSFTVSKGMKNGAIELYDEEGSKFIDNKQRVKPYQKNLLDTNKDDDVTLDDEREVM
ncbi:reverse transcriptase domain-containing protein, partial [Tanacetum coccineum]